MRTPEITTALEYVRKGVEGSCLVDYKHKATISWTIDTLAAEVERLEDACSLHEGIIEACETERNAAISRAEAAEARVTEPEAQNARLREALEEIAASHDSPDNDRIAKAALAELADRLREGT